MIRDCLHEMQTEMTRRGITWSLPAEEAPLIQAHTAMLRQILVSILANAIDVLPQEPPVDGNPLLAPDIPNLIVTPHVAWAAREARQRCLDEMAANVEDFARGGHRGRVV